MKIFLATLFTFLSACHTDSPPPNTNLDPVENISRKESMVKESPETKNWKLSDSEWKSRLSPQEYYILRKKGTERPFTGDLLNEKRKGKFLCAGCGTHLFESKDKFKSGTGWPSFTRSVKSNVAELADNTHGMLRVEVLCAKCDGHLGHVFPDGPAPTYERFCINSASLDFRPESAD